MKFDRFSAPTTTSTKNTTASNGSVQWEYKTDNTSEDTKLNGPFTTEQMMKMANVGKFDEFQDKVWCRRIDTEQFYLLKRIDFELYIE